MYVPPATRGAFRRRCLTEVEASYGSAARAAAADALARPDRLDLVGAAHLAGVPPVPENATLAVERYALEVDLGG